MQAKFIKYRANGICGYAAKFIRYRANRIRGYTGKVHLSCGTLRERGLNSYVIVGLLES
ncbi:hypothetical protein [Nostoc sp.]